ncbi:MAG: carboxypeptidase-like regulatory domain-containing protein [Aquaticitalea sp.]
MNLKLFALSVMLLMFSNAAFPQQIKGQIIDAKTNETIAFATVQFDDDHGVVSNMEGYFSFSLDQLNIEKPLIISFMGYQTQNLTIKDLEAKNYIIKLNEAVNQLKTVYLTNKVPSVDSIMARVNRNLNKNYNFSNLKYTLFSRETVFFKANDLEVDIEKSSNFSKKKLDASNNQFKELANQIVNNPPTQTFTDALTELYLKPDFKGKMEVKQATKLKDRKNSLSLETIQSRVTNIILQHLDSSKTYKVKTGWFKVEDSMSLKKSKKEEKEIDDNSFDELKSTNINSISEHLFESQSKLDFVKDIDGYDYELSNITAIDDQLVYVITFKPRKNRTKFMGTLYINGIDYAIQKLDYSFAQGKIGEKLNLKLILGIKYVENVNKGTVIYKKNSDDTCYYPYYINSESGRYVYLHRPFKFIENSDDSNNKVAFDITIEGSIIEKHEQMTLDNQVSSDDTFKALVEAKKIDFIQLKQYDSSIWKEYSILEPLEELKKFKVEE